MKKHAIALFVVALVGATLPMAGLADDAFEDVPAGHVFAADIAWLANAGITRGCNPPENSRFCPDDNVTRGQMAAFLTRALNLPSAGGTFDDTVGHVFVADIAALAEAGVTKGCNPPSNSRFCPDDSVTRGQMAAFLNRALGLEAASSAFDDTLGHVFAADIAALADAGITKGCNPPDNSRFCPDAAVTRGQMAAFLNRALATPALGAGIIYGHWDGLGGDPYRFDLDAPNPTWEEFFGGSAELSDVVASTNEWVGTTEGAWITPNLITFIDLDTQVETETLVWPRSGETPGREIKIHLLAVSNDGSLLAAQVTEWIDEPHLEVVRRGANPTVVGSGFDENLGASGATALEWTPANDLVVAGWGDADGETVPVIGVIPSAGVTGSTPYEQVGDVYIALTYPGAGAIEWVALSHDGSEIVFVERGNVWAADFEPGATPRQLTTGFWAGALGPGWTAQFSPDGSHLALANQVHQQFIIPNHTGPPINLGLAENEDRYQVGETLVNYIDAWLP